MKSRNYRVLGIPLRAGSLAPGNEKDHEAYRDIGFVDMLKAAGLEAHDEGALMLPSYLPHHSVPPIRNWPAPRIVWEMLVDRLSPMLSEESTVPLLVGCDCSVVLGTVAALQSCSEEVYVLYIDGDLDHRKPDRFESESAAYLATWLLTHPSPFWNGNILPKERITVVGFQGTLSDEAVSHASISLATLRERGGSTAAEQVLQCIPTSASIVLHLDTDILHQDEMPTAYFPHHDGIRMNELSSLLDVFLGDPRIRIIEVSEYASLRDPKRDLLRRFAGVLVDALCV